MNDKTSKQHCAACGNTSTALKTCAACKSVWYCNRACQLADHKAHRSMCKTFEKARNDGAGDVVDVPGSGKLVAVSSNAHTVQLKDVEVSEISGTFGASVGAAARSASSTSNEEDDDLFAPPPPREECPVCMITLPLLNQEANYMACCGNVICRGCFYENRRVLDENNANRIAMNLPLLDGCCPFCRKVFSKTNTDYMDRLQKRVDFNDPHALYNMAVHYRFGEEGLHRDMAKAFALTQRAANLGLSEAAYDLGVCYAKGGGVSKDQVKERHYFELAAKRGDVEARHILGCMEEVNGNPTLACKHWVIAASAGGICSLKEVKRGYCMGLVSKEDYASTLRAHQKARDEQWSKEREKHKWTDLPPNNSLYQ